MHQTNFSEKIPHGGFSPEEVRQDVIPDVIQSTRTENYYIPTGLITFLHHVNPFVPT